MKLMEAIAKYNKFDIDLTDGNGVAFKLELLPKTIERIIGDEDSFDADYFAFYKLFINEDCSPNYLSVEDIRYLGQQLIKFADNLESDVEIIKNNNETDTNTTA